MRLLRSPFAIALALSLALPLPQGAAPASAQDAASDIETVSAADPLAPEVTYGLERGADGLRLKFTLEGFRPGAADASLRVGVAADRQVILEARNAAITPSREGNTATWRFRVPAARLIRNPEGWRNLRLAFDVTWAGPILGAPRLKQRYRHLDHAAPHAGLSPDPARWQPLDLNAWENEIADRRQEIAIDFRQPMDGRATVVIEDAGGRRIRNLISGEPAEAGRHRFRWDGLDENGVLQPPGAYRWRAISHPGLKPVYEMSFANAPGSNHGTFHAAATNGQVVILGTQLSEGGHQVVILEKDGTPVRGMNAPHGAGLGRVQVAADEKYVYAAYDGAGWGAGVDRSKRNWAASYAITLIRFEIATGAIVDFPGKPRLPRVLEYRVGPGSPGGVPDQLALRGLVLLEGKLYLADHLNGRIRVVDPANAQEIASFPLEKPWALAAGGGALFAVTGDRALFRIDPASGKATRLATVPGNPSGLALDAQGRFYVSDQETQLIRVLDPGGKEIGQIGHGGGVTPGPYDPLRFHNPEGLVVSDNLLWVTEKQRWQPKRFAAFDLLTGKARHQFFGPTAYGAPGAGFDPQDETRWIGQGTLFKLDFERKSATPLSVLGGEDGRRHTFWRQDGRTFVITSGKITTLQELTAQGTLKPLAASSSAHQFCFAHQWHPPEVFLEAFRRDYPEVPYLKGEEGGMQVIRPDHGYGMLWVDRNGDGEMQAAEIEFATGAENLGGNGWSHDFHDLTLRLPGTVNGKNVLVTLKPDGWWPGGAPKYPPLAEAIAAAVPIDLPGRSMRGSAVDRFGNLIVTSSPMTAFSPDGRLLWHYRNEWDGVHGSHKAPLPSTGELQGVLFFSGIAPLDKESDVFLLNGNHGRAFVMTSDGLYLDEMFKDVRLLVDTQGSGVGILGGECFGGTFGRSEKTGNYYFQGGGIEYRIYRIEGLKETIRQQGDFTVGEDQLAAARRALLRRQQEATRRTVARAVRLAKPPTPDGKDSDWREALPIAWNKRGQFPVSVRIGYDDTHLYLFYKVADDSPWVNHGGDWQTLFKTGDGVDLQLATDANADPRRKNAAPGDLRLFIAPQGEQNVAVLYRHRAPGAKQDDGVTFQSPWRSERVDRVKKLENLHIGIVRNPGEYVAEIAVPLAELGIASPDGLRLKGDFGVIYGDAAGTINLFRNYWSNQVTGLINDVPGEIMLHPDLWGVIEFGEKP